jgi:hypothetical protein
MANQQGKKTETGQSTAPGPGAAAPGQRNTGAIPASGQDTPQGAGMSGQTPRAGGTTNTGSGQTADSTGSQNTATQNMSGGQPISEKISSTASGILDKAKETASGTYDAVANQATSKIEEHKGELSTGLRTLADTFRKTGSDLKNAEQKTPLTDVTGRYSGLAADQIENVAGYFERKDLRAMMRDAEGFARRNPAIFLGAAFALGMAAARFLKSSAPDGANSMSAGGLNRSMPTALPPADRLGNPATRTT